MATLNRRLDVLEQTADVRREAARWLAIDEFTAWIRANATADELAAWDRDMLNQPINDEALERVGVSRATRDEILAEVGPVQPGDVELIEAMWQRVPAELYERLKALG